MKTAYAYARFSSENQREESIDAQVRAIMEYAARENIHVLRVYKDEAFSARTDKRPAFQELFGLIREHPADYLIVHKLDRFARNRADAAFYRQKLKEAGMKLVSVLERLDDAPESIILEGVLESINEYYSANLSRETKKGLKENILNGKRNGGKCPRGYILNSQHLYPSADAEKVMECFRMYAAGKPYSEIIKMTGGWNLNTIRSILKNEVYLGVLKSGENRFENAHEAIIDRDTFDQCQRRISNSRMNAANRAKVDYMLSGMCVCGKCGKTMNGLTGGRGGYSYYACHTRGCKAWPREKLEKRVVKELSEHMKPTDEIKAKFYELVSARVNNKARVEEAKKTNAILSQRISKILNAVQYADGEMAEYLLNQAKELKDQMVPVPEIRDIPKEVCDAYVETFRDLELKPYEEQKQTVRKLISKIVVTDDDLTLFTVGNREAYYIVKKQGLS